MTRTRNEIEALVVRMQDDFLETPGLAVRLPQAPQRFGVDLLTCAAVLELLREAGVLTTAPDGAYTRRLAHIARAA